MMNVAIRKEWYEEIKDRIWTNDAQEYVDHRGTVMVEVDIDESEFIAVSTELGWMI